jgi:eukaryotic-like serine/threonine-protein kinase
MGWRERLRVSSPAPIAAALESEVARLERVVLYGWLGTWMVLVASNVLALALVPGFGTSTLLLPLAFGFWFSLRFYLMRRGRGRLLREWITPAVEGVIPWAGVWALTRVQGATYALGSWVPPMLFGCVMCVGILRLRPIVPLLVGTVGAVQYALLYFLFVRHRLTPEELAMPLYGTRMQTVRVGSVVLGGILAAALALGLRRALGNAATVVRAQDLFGKYRIERSIAAGGMATVYAATYCPEGGFERPVAIKRIHPHLSRFPSFVDAFRNEAELCARLVHRNIVQVFDFGRVAETYFLAMEFVDGVTVAAIMKSTRASSTRVSPSLVAWLGREMLEGLAYSHAGARDATGGLLRVVHRDVSPSNVLVSKTGDVKLSDFGLARALREARAYTTETIAGHLSYMAPEQATGHETDERSDLFAVSIILWELLTGTTLFKREFEGATILAIVKEAIPAASTLRADIGSAWDEFFTRALDRDPSQRFQSAREMSGALLVLYDAVGPLDERELTSLVARVSEEVKLRRTKDEMPTVVGGHTEDFTGSVFDAESIPGSVLGHTGS